VWQTDVDYEKLVMNNWLKGPGQNGLQGVVDALQSLQIKLSDFGAKEFGLLARTIRNLRQKLDRLRRNSMGCGPSDEEKATMKKLKQALHQEEIWMKQRSRVLWLHEGDRNTSYFDRQAAQRKRVNRIESPERADGSKCGSVEDNHIEVQNFYQALYNSQGFREMDELLNFVQPEVSQQMNDGMDAVYTEDEIKTALF
jgi:hypothetical protein